MSGNRLSRWLAVCLLAWALACAAPLCAFAEEGGGSLAAGTTADDSGADAPADDSGDPPLETGDTDQPDIKAAPTADARVAAPGLKYRTNAGKKWTKWAKSGKVSGKAGKGKHLEQLKVAKAAGLSLRYRVAVNGKWQGWKKPGAAAGRKGKSINALEVQLSGSLKARFDVAYRVYVSGKGWQPWALNGAAAGKRKKSNKVEAVQVKLVQKRSYQRIANGAYTITLPGNAAAAFAAGGSVSKGALKVSALNQRFFVRNQAGAVTVQAVSTGSYLVDAGGRIALVPQSSLSGDAHLWKPFWNGGFVLYNVGTGNSLAASGGTLAATAAGGALSISSTDIIPEGSYSLTNAASGTLLDVKDESAKNKANIQVFSAKGSNGSQVFKFKRAGTSTYRLVNASSEKGVEVKGSNVRQNKAKNKKSQKWAVTLDAAGKLVFRSRSAGKVLTAAGSGASGSNAVVAADTGRAAQRWTVKAAKYKYKGISGDKKLDKALKKINAKHFSLRSAFNYVVHFGYRSGARYWSGPSVLSNSRTKSMAKDMISHHSGNCYRFASLFCWIAKSKGYDARVRSGWVASASGGRAPHGWAEVKVDGSWLICDPDLAHELPGHNWYMVSYGGAPTAYHFW